MTGHRFIPTQPMDRTRRTSPAPDSLSVYLDEWEASYGMGGRPLPSHWGIAQRIADLRVLSASIVRAAS